MRGGIARERRIEHSQQLQLDLERAVVQAGDKLCECAVLATDVHYPIESVAQLYRDRADAENAFDEMKNQWA